MQIIAAFSSEEVSHKLSVVTHYNSLQKLWSFFLSSIEMQDKLNVNVHHLAGPKSGMGFSSTVQNSSKGSQNQCYY